MAEARLTTHVGQSWPAFLRPARIAHRAQIVSEFVWVLHFRELLSIPGTSGGSSVGARFRRARLNDWIDFYREPGALETRPYRTAARRGNGEEFPKMQNPDKSQTI